MRNPQSAPSKKKAIASHRVTTYTGKGAAQRQRVGVLNNFKPDQASRIRPMSVNQRMRNNFSQADDIDQMSVEKGSIDRDMPATAKYRTFKLSSSQRTKLNGTTYQLKSSLFGGNRVREVTFEDDEKSCLPSELGKTYKTEENCTVRGCSAEKKCNSCCRNSVGSDTIPEERRSIIKSRCANPRCNGSLSRKTQDSRRGSQTSKRTSSLNNKQTEERERRSAHLSKHSDGEERRSALVTPRVSMKSVKIQTEMSINSARDACCHTVCVECDINKSVKLLPPRPNSSGKKSKSIEPNHAEDGNLESQRIEITGPSLQGVKEDDDLQLLNDHEQDPFLTLISDGTVDAIPTVEPIPPVAPLYSDLDRIKPQVVKVLERLNLTLSYSHPSLSLKVNKNSVEKVPMSNRQSNRQHPEEELPDQANPIDSPGLTSNEIKRLAFLKRVNIKVREYDDHTSTVDCTLGELYRQIEDRSYRSIDKMKVTSTPKYPDTKEMIYCLSKTVHELVKAGVLERDRKDKMGFSGRNMMIQTPDRPNEKTVEIRNPENKRVVPKIPLVPLPMDLMNLDQSEDQKMLIKAEDIHKTKSEYNYKGDGISDAGNERTMREEIAINASRENKKNISLMRSPPSKKSPKKVKNAENDHKITSEMLQDWKKGLELINKKAIEQVDFKFKDQTRKDNTNLLGLSLLQAGKKLIEKELKDLKNRTKFDFTFEEKNSEGSELPKLEEIEDFITNIVMSCKIIRQGIVISLIYLEKLMLGAMVNLTEKNWKNLMLTALVLSSKIWDDESFENHNFSKALPSFETQRIDAMERMFLEAIDYEVLVEKSDYTKYYFNLKRFEREARRAERRNHLKPNTFYEISKRENRKEKHSQLKQVTKNKLSRNKSIDVIV